MSHSPGREARLRPEFAHLYPSIVADRWDLASVVADQVARLLRGPNAARVSTDRILPAEHFEFRGKSPRRDPAHAPKTRQSDAPATGG
jgi:hypothetical protein